LYWHIFPVCFIEGQGQTAFKIYAEYAIIFLLFIAAYLLYKYQSFEQVVQRPNFVLQMGIMVLISIPLIYIGRKMNNSIFSAPIKDLSKKIEELS
ncbi:MAG: hypothetical protein EOO89_20315, partial [Pedobacter sp.]